MEGDADYSYAELQCLSGNTQSGTTLETDEEGRIIVRTKDDLYEVRSNPSGRYIQMADIIFTEEDFSEDGDYYNMGLGWEPIGTSSTPFKGVYDGNGYVIRNLKIASDKNYCGLFGYANEAKLKNIVLENADISGRSYVGGIVGYITGDGDDSVNSCSVGGSIHGKDYVGGIAGEVDSYVSVDKNRNSADVSGEKNVGGIAGYVYSPNSNSVSNSYNTGSISGSSYTGGIIGYGRGGVSRSYSIGSVTGTSNFGGIAGVGSATYSYYLYTGVTNPTNTAGTPKDTAGLKKQGTYEQWDFGSIWTMEGDANYPYAELQCFTVTGTVSVTGEVRYDSTVSVDVSAAERLHNSYAVTWYADGEEIGSGDPFRIPAEAVGKALTATVTSTDPAYRGSLTSDAVIVSKATCVTGPLGSELLDKSTSAFLISTEDNQEYSLDTVTWQNSGVFTGLEPGTDYTVYTRVAENDLYFAGEPITAIIVTTEHQSISGIVTITGEAQFSRELTVNVELVSPLGATFRYEWRCGEDVLGTEATYTPTAAEIGKSITVTLIGTGKYAGTLESAPVTIDRCDIAIAAATLIETHTYTREDIVPMLALKNGPVNLRKDTDYTCEYRNNVNVGTATIHVTGIGNYQGTKDVSFTIEPKSVELLNMATIPNAYYTGSAIEPELTILHGNYPLVKGQDYDAVFSNHTAVGTATVKVSGKGNYSGTLTKTFEIVRRSLERASVTTPQPEYDYTESPITPEVTVVLDGVTLKKDVDYTVSYADNLREGVATVTVTGTGGYQGTAKTTFRITGHIYGDWINEKEPTCTETGLKYRACSGCGNRIEETIPALGHDFADEIVPPTLTEPGYTKHTCTRCGYTETGSYTDPVPCAVQMSCSTVYISIGTYQNAVIIAASYKQSGQMLEVQRIPTEKSRTEYSYTFEQIEEAASVKVFYLDSKTLAPLSPVQSFTHTVGQGHTYESKILKAANCQFEGLMEFSCIYGDHSYTEPIAKTDHTPVSIPAVAADCTHTGLSEGSKCSVCGTILKAQETIPAKGHTPVLIPSVAPDCTHTGLTEGSKCSICGAILKAQETVPAKGHTPVLIPAVAPDCTHTGLTEGSKCSVCGMILKAQETVPAKGHTPVTIPATAPTCIRRGLSAGSKCSVCGTIIKEQAIVPATGHNWSPTGSQYPKTCTVCGAKQNLSALDYLKSYIVKNGTSNGNGGYYLNKTKDGVEFTYSLFDTGTIRMSTTKEDSSKRTMSTLDLVQGESVVKGMLSITTTGIALKTTTGYYSISPATFQSDTIPTERDFQAYGVTITPALKADCAELYTTMVCLNLAYLFSEIMIPNGYAPVDLGFNSFY